ncbi:pitrilysin family protein [Clostridium sp. BJN0001]|uniref:M16 family metallopeptidase n=1 Tax=Clostridium sp. BJN0001 TaxID=2930219 RepID=UPI001FD111DA|nr:pitrilysin family protein [Clostridium sp. BJN0001]
MYSIYKLSNGLRIVTEKMEYLESVSIGVMVQNGSRNETLQNNGISHFIEHMFFKGTEKRDSKKIITDIENLGGQINAFTSKEATCFYVKTLSEHINSTIDVLSDIIINSKFSEEEIEKEKKVINEEIKMSSDQPEDVLDDTFAKAAFGSTSLSFPILGTKETVNSFKRQDIIEFINEKYTPYNAVISVCGNFDEKELIKVITEYFGKWTGKEYIPKYEKVELENESISAKKDIEQLQISLGLNGIKYGDEKLLPSMALLNNIFGGGASSILFQKIREEMGFCYSIGSYLQPYQGIGVFNIYAFVNKKYSKEALSSIVSEVDKLSKKGISDELMNINKEKIKANYVLGLESTTARMFKNAKTYLFLNKVRTQEDVIDSINKINQTSINDALSCCFKKGVINAAYLSNDDDKRIYDQIVFKK